MPGKVTKAQPIWTPEGKYFLKKKKKKRKEKKKKANQTITVLIVEGNKN